MEVKTTQDQLLHLTQSLCARRSIEKESNIKISRYNISICIAQ